MYRRKGQRPLNKSTYPTGVSTNLPIQLAFPQTYHLSPKRKTTFEQKYLSNWHFHKPTIYRRKGKRPLNKSTYPTGVSTNLPFIAEKENDL